MHISLPPSAYIMKVKLPRLKEEPKNDASEDASGDGAGGAQLAETELGSETVRYQAMMESFLEDQRCKVWVIFYCLNLNHPSIVYLLFLPLPDPLNSWFVP